MDFRGLQKTTLLDYPGIIAATVFTAGCNFRCPFCHNGDLVLAANQLSRIEETEILAFLQKRKGILKGLCISGGEPTLQKGLPEFIQKVKDLGYLVKLDTNGSNPEMLKALLEKDLLDYVAMDIKNSPESYEKTIGVMPLNHCQGSIYGNREIEFPKMENETKFDIKIIAQSIQILKKSNIPCEFRTTLVKKLHTEADMRAIANWLPKEIPYYLQCYEENEQVIKPGFHPPTKETMKRYQDILSEKLEQVYLRGVL